MYENLKKKYLKEEKTKTNRSGKYYQSFFYSLSGLEFIIIS